MIVKAGGVCCEMMKWLILAAGIFLFFNGMFTRTYSYADPERHCFQMDYIRLVGCFGNSTVPILIGWGAAALGGGLILWSFIRGRREKA